MDAVGRLVNFTPDTKHIAAKLALPVLMTGLEPQTPACKANALTKCVTAAKIVTTTCLTLTHLHLKKN